MTKERAAQKNPFEKFMSRLNTHQGPPRKPPAYKFLMRHPDYKQAVYDEYKRRFGPGDRSKGSDTGEQASGPTSASGPPDASASKPSASKPSASDPSSSNLSASDPSASNSSTAAASSGKSLDSSERTEESAPDADADADNGESSDEDEENPQYALSHRVQVAKQMFARLSKEEKEELKTELEKDYNEKKELYEKAAKGEDLYDPGLLTE